MPSPYSTERIVHTIASVVAVSFVAGVEGIAWQCFAAEMIGLVFR